MESCVKAFLNKKGYDVNDKALTIIHVCDDWYANRLISQKDAVLMMLISVRCLKSMWEKGNRRIL